MRKTELFSIALVALVVALAGCEGIGGKAGSKQKIEKGPGVAAKAAELGEGTFRVKINAECLAWVNVQKDFSGVTKWERWIYDKDWADVSTATTLDIEGPIPGRNGLITFKLLKDWIEGFPGESMYDGMGLKPVGDKHTKSRHSISSDD